AAAPVRHDHDVVRNEIDAVRLANPGAAQQLEPGDGDLHLRARALDLDVSEPDGVLRVARERESATVGRDPDVLGAPGAVERGPNLRSRLEGDPSIGRRAAGG